MIGLALLLGARIAAAGGFERLELLSEGDGAFVWEQAPLLAARPGITAALALAQVEAVWSVGARGLTVGAGLSSQSVQWERRLGTAPLRFMVGAQARSLLPVGAQAGIGGQRGAWMVGAGLALSAAATWDLPQWTTWAVRPTLLVAWSPRRTKASPAAAPPVMPEGHP
jgi:hypothetical protein